MGGDTPCTCFSLRALEDSQRLPSFPGSFFHFTQLIPRHCLLPFSGIILDGGGPAVPCVCGMKVGVLNTPLGVLFRRVGYEETLMPCFFPKSIPITDPPLRGGVEGPCCDTPTNGTEGDWKALSLAGTNLL